MTFLADARYRPKDRPNRRPRLPFRDSYSPDEPRNKYGQWEGNAGVIGLTNAASTIRRFTQKNPAGVRFVIGQNGDVGYGSSYGATHSQISEETGIGHAAIHGWMSTAGEDKRFVAWHNSPEGIKAGVENDETLPTEAHPFLGSLEQQGFRNAKLGESGYFDAAALLDALFDAAPSRDPTGTSDLRRDFERELKDRWQRLDRCLNKAVGISDALGLSPIGVLSLIPATDRMKHFRSWLDELLSHLIVSGGGWMQVYLDEAGRRASSRAAGLDPRKAAGGGLPTAPRIAGHTTDAAEDEPRDDHGRWTAGGDAHGISPEVKQHISGIMGGLSGAYPEVAKFIKGMDFTHSVTNEFDPFTQKIRVSSAQLGGSVEELNKFHETANKAGFSVSGGMGALLTHEFAHAIDHYIISHGDESGKDEWFDTKKRLEKEIGSPSEYGKRSTREWFAEQFTAETLGQKPKQLTPVIEQFLRGKKDARIAGHDGFDPDEPRNEHGEWASGARGNVEQTNTPEFKAWFGASKVVDDEGKPLIVYHGSSSDIGGEFSLKKIGSRVSWDQGYLGRGFYFANAKTASAYGSDPSGGNVTPVFLSLQNPLKIDAQFLPITDPKRTIPVEIDRAITVRKALGLDEKATSNDVTEAAHAKGYDGVIYNYRGAKEYAAFDPTQIKSAIGNKGTFDPQSPKITDEESGIRDFGACADTSDSSANTTSASTTPKSPAIDGFDPDERLTDSATEDAILVLATSELQGICDAFAQQATRLVAHCVLTRARPQRAAQGIRQLIATVGLQRTRMMADYLIVKAHACATLEAFREAGVTHVGTVAEMVPHNPHFGSTLEDFLEDEGILEEATDYAIKATDAARKTPQHQHPITGKFITKTAATREWGRRASGKFGNAPKVYNRSLKHRKALRGMGAAGEEEVNIQTAGDDRVCQACQNVAAAGPYPINEAMDLIPLHPRCRCVFIPTSLDEGGSNSRDI